MGVRDSVREMYVREKLLHCIAMQHTRAFHGMTFFAHRQIRVGHVSDVDDRWRHRVGRKDRCSAP